MSKLKKIIALGIGCRRGVSCGAISEAVLDVLDKFSIERESLSFAASVDLKADEAGLLEFADKWGLDLRFFSKNELEQVEVPNPSGTVLGKIGIPSVSEAAALLSISEVVNKQENDKISCKLIVEKQKYGNITVAVVELIIKV